MIVDTDTETALAGLAGGWLDSDALERLDWQKGQPATMTPAQLDAAWAKVPAATKLRYLKPGMALSKLGETIASAVSAPSGGGTGGLSSGTKLALGAGVLGLVVFAGYKFMKRREGSAVTS